MNAGAVGASIESQLDVSANASIYRDNTSGTAFGGDDSGFVPANKNAEKCQNLTAKQLALLIGAVSKCHNKMAAQAMKSAPFDEEGCENAAVAKFTAFTGKLTNCPPCLTALLPNLGAAAANGIDAALGSTYCASPSGAFVDVRE